MRKPHGALEQVGLVDFQRQVELLIAGVVVKKRHHYETLLLDEDGDVGSQASTHERVVKSHVAERRQSEAVVQTLSSAGYRRRGL